MARTASNQIGVFEPHLRPDERLLWAGRSGHGAADTRLIVPFAIGVFGAIALGGVIATNLQPGEDGVTTGLIALVSVVFLSFPLGLSAYAAWRFLQSMDQHYALTNERLIIIPAKVRSKVRSLQLHWIDEVQRRGPKMDTLLFRLTEAGYDRFKDFAFITINIKGGTDPGSPTLLTLRHLTALDAVPDRFFKISDAAKVAALIDDARNAEELHNEQAP